MSKHNSKNEKRPVVEVLISAMHQKDLDIFRKTGINTDALLINQCDRNDTIKERRSFGTVRCIYTTERGLSRSRNMALDNAIGKYCLICDDDERLVDNYAEIIKKGFDNHPDAGIVCFQLKHPRKKYTDRSYKVGYLRSLKISSWQIAFRRDMILRTGIKFDTRFGSGTPLGSGEENIFLYDCLKRGIKIYYEPKCIGKVAQETSQWFKGFDEQYFINKGTIIRELMGSVLGFVYCVYFILTKRSLYSSCTSPKSAFKSIMKGLKRKV